MLKRKLTGIIGLGSVVFLTLWYLANYDLWTTQKFDWPPERVYTLYTGNSSYTYPMHLLPPNDYNQLMDLENFSFSMLNQIDENNTSILLLVLIHSAPENFNKRQVIRETWGQKDYDVKFVFAVAAVLSEKVQEALEKENNEYQDLIQGNFLDAYRNMTYKHIMVFKYAIYYFPKAKYILKTDDDVFLNIPTLKNFLTLDMSPYGAANVLFCNLVKNRGVIRKKGSKWEVSYLDYPDKRYPPYCPGWVMLYSPDVIFNLYRAAQISNEYFWIDDVHITGTLARQVGIVHTDIERFMLPRQIMKDTVKHSSNITSLKPFLFASYNLNERTIRELWNYVTSHPVPQGLVKML